MHALDTVALVPVIIGALNWGLISFFQFNLISALFGANTKLTRIIYAIIGICGLYTVLFFGHYI